METKFQFEIIINVLVFLSGSLEYVNYWYIAITNIFILSVRGQSLYVKIWHLQTSDFDV